VFFNVLEQI